MGDQDDQRHINFTPVHADRADEYEEWVRTTLVPAVRRVRPALEGRWQTLRATEASDGVVYFAFILEGGELSEWEIDPLLREANGDEAAARDEERWNEMVRGKQIGGTFRALDF
jgi:hypothetical protein